MVCSSDTSPGNVMRSAGCTSIFAVFESGTWPWRLSGAYTSDVKLAYSAMTSRLVNFVSAACRDFCIFLRTLVRCRWHAASVRSRSSSFFCRMRSTLSSLATSRFWSRSANAVRSNVSRLSWSSRIWLSRSAQSRNSCASISCMRTSRLDSSVGGGSICWKSRFCRVRSMICSSASVTGSPDWNVRCVSARTSGTWLGVMKYSGEYGSVCASDSR
mmetsp:Transcript_109840/g.310788  ORF Transcript_109840/g.310788 Transcript_109840/m.310788 type:complete len:215 (+) Transcript_109840:1097-1741(+)